MGVKKTYTKEFKKMIVELYENGKQPVELVREYGISSRLIYYWKKQYGTVKLTEEGATVNMQDLLKIQKENKLLKEENEILKKAVAIFTKK